ncbi:MAG: dihydrofolate reductase family protein, partial [Gemmatimonadaceae bacterium]
MPQKAKKKSSTAQRKRAGRKRSSAARPKPTKKKSSTAAPKREGRRVRYGVAMSLDGYIADSNGGYDWIVQDPDIDFAEIYSRFDTLVMGRGTYEATLAMGGGGNEQPGVKRIVISRTLNPTDHPKVTIATDVRAVIDDLKATPGKDIWLFGGGR